MTKQQKTKNPMMEDLFEEKAAMQGFITVFREALKGDKKSVTFANRILDEWQKMCDEIPIDNKDNKKLTVISKLKDIEEDYDENLPDFVRATLKRTPVNEYHLGIKLYGTDIGIWREIKVPSNLELDFLGHLLIDIMGWEDEHLFQFMHNNTSYSDQESVDMSFSGNVKLYSEFALSDLLKNEGDIMMFEYDFGDSWMHNVWVKGIRPYRKGEKHKIEFVDGQGACPPEDCGGVPGYENLLRIFRKKRKSAEEKEELKWYGIDRYYDPNEFDSEYAESAIEYWNSEL